MFWGNVWIAVSRLSSREPQATHKIQTLLWTLVKCNRLKAELAGCEYKRRSTCTPLHVVYVSVSTQHTWERKPEHSHAGYMGQLLWDYYYCHYSVDTHAAVQHTVHSGNN